MSTTPICFGTGSTFLANSYLLKVNNRNIRKRCKIFSEVNNKNTRMTSLPLF